MTQSAELLEIRSLARDFAGSELRPHVERWDADRALDDDVVAKLAELGFFGMLVPDANGGMGLDMATWVAALEELAWGDAGVALLVAQSVIATDLLLRYGGDAHAETVSELATGGKTGCIAVADADTSTDGAAAPRAARTGGSDWTFSGTTHWVTNGSNADVVIALVHVDDSPALFALPRDTGYRVGARAATMGLRTVPVVDLDLDGATAPPTARLDWSLPAAIGPTSGAAAVSTSAASDVVDPLGALSAAAIAVGIAQAAVEHATRYADVREQFGRPIRSFEAIQVKLAEMATRSVAARSLVERAAAMPEDTSAAAMAKLAAGACAMFVTTEAVQIYGGYGYMRDYPVEKLMRDAKAIEMLHGSSEMQRLRIAAALYAG